MAEPSEMPEGLERRACKKCGCPLAFVMGPNGKLIPLDLRSPVYSVGEDLMGKPVAVPMPGARVTHFATCKSASEFSGTKARKR